MEKNVKIAGVSIIEILIAMFLVALALFTIATLFPRMGAHGKSIHEADQAKMIAMEVLEGLQMFSGDENFDCGAGFNEVVSPGYNDFRDRVKKQTIGAVTYKITNSTDDDIYDKNCGGTNDINTVTVTVSWTKSGKTHKIDVTGVIR